MYQTHIYVHFILADRLGDWLTPKRVLACRKLVIWLMRHTTALNNGAHCPQLVRVAFGKRNWASTVVEKFVLCSEVAALDVGVKRDFVSRRENDAPIEAIAVGLKSSGK
jgi:hypothetical protein